MYRKTPILVQALTAVVWQSYKNVYITALLTYKTELFHMQSCRLFTVLLNCAQCENTCYAKQLLLTSVI